MQLSGLFLCFHQYVVRPVGSEKSGSDVSGLMNMIEAIICIFMYLIKCLYLSYTIATPEQLVNGMGSGWR